MRLVSIIIPCFNSEAFIADAIQSALNQTYPDVEVIAVDDGSTDNTVSVLKRFGKKIRWVTGPNKGACSARNIGLTMAKGEYIQFLDSDDLLSPEKIKRSLEVMSDKKNILVYSLHEVVALDPEEPVPFQWNRSTGNEDPIIFMLRGDLPTPAPVHRKSVIDSVGGFREDLNCAQDREFHLRIALEGVEFRLIPEKLFTIRRRQGSIGSSNEEGVHEQRGFIAWDIYKELQSNSRLTESYRVECAGMLMKAARGLLRTRTKRAQQFIRMAYEVHPSGGVNVVYSERSQIVLQFFGPRITEEIIWHGRRIGLLSK